VSVLLNAGKTAHLMATSSIPIRDDTDSIFEALHQAALVQQAGGKAALNFSALRPAGDSVGGNGKASGPLSFMAIFDKATEEMKKGGKRRGLVSVVLQADHPDSKAFVTAKYDLGLRTLRLFVSLSDRFMQAVEKNGNIILVNPRTEKIVGKANAAEFLTLIAESIWRTGSPDIVFLDEFNRHAKSEAISISPSGDVALTDKDPCPVGSINLAHVVKDGAIDFERLKKRVWQAVHFLDNVIDLAGSENGLRRIRVGVMGFADMLVQLKIRYSSDKALKVAEELMAFVTAEARAASSELAKKRGSKKERLRNAMLTGAGACSTLSVIAGCAPGIEAFNSLVSRDELNKNFVKAVQEEGVHSPELMDKIKNAGTLKGAFIPVWIKKVFVVSREIPAEWHLKMQAAFQKHCDHGVGKKIYVPYEASVDDVKKVILDAYSLKCRTVMVRRLENV
jgi:ribonucleoside-diphosphate reductase alpha chain